MATYLSSRNSIKTDLAYTFNPDNFGITVKTALKDISPLAIGQARLNPGQQAETASLCCVTLFFSCEGSGSFKLNDIRYHVKKHEFFVLPIGSLTFLCADSKTGWAYRWISFSGALAQDFMAFPTVFPLPEDLISTLYDPTEGECNLASRLAVDLYHIHTIMHKPEEKNPDYVQSVINRINTSYMEKLTVTEMADELGLNRSHLSRLFKARMDITIQEYIVHFRTRKAKQYLLNGYSISDTAQLCGFGDSVNFSRAFLKETGCRPTIWLKYMKQDSYNRPR